MFFCRINNWICSQTTERYTNIDACQANLQTHLPGETTGVCYTTTSTCQAECVQPTATPTPPPDAPTPTNTPTPTGGDPLPQEDPLNTSYCDACGYCYSDPDNVPSDWEDCRDCLYPGVGGASARSQDTLRGHPTPHPDHYYTMLGCLSTVPGEFTEQMTTVAFSVVGGIAFLALLYGAFIVATSRGNRDKLNYGKRIIYGALAGLLFVLFSTFLIRFVASDILKIPGFGE